MKKCLFLLLGLLMLIGCKQETVTGIFIYDSYGELYVGKEVTLLIGRTPEDIPSPVVTWMSSNTAVAQVGADGVVRGISGGQAIITAQTHNNLTATCAIIVIGPNADGVIQMTRAGELKWILRELDLLSTTKLALSGAINSRDLYTIRTELLALEHLDISATNLEAGSEVYLIGMTKLKTVILPKSVTSIGRSAFGGCSSLTSVTIPKSVTSIGGSAFSSCSSLASITIPNSVTSIGEYTFSSCSSLTSIAIPNSVTSIGERAFYGCSSLTSVTIPNGVTSIGGFAFDGCSSLTSVTIPNSVTSIGAQAFYRCDKAVFTMVSSSPIPYASSMFSDSKEIRVPQSSIDRYKAAKGWKDHTFIGY